MGDPITAGLQLATALVTLVTKIYDDTPVATRQANIEKWDKIIDGAGKFLTTGKLP